MLLRRACRPFRPAAALRLKPHSSIATIKMSKTDHSERTATEPRDPSLHKVILARVEDINPMIRTFRLDVPLHSSGIKFLPGQWLDVYVPGIDKPGGFTITSPPSKAWKSTRAAAATTAGQHSSSTDADRDDTPSPYLELAVQNSPDNVVAKWLWQPAPSILSSELQVRVGGSFVWPPPGVVPTTLRKILFVAGGVGINPLMSILSHLAGKPPATAAAQKIHFLYSTRDPSPAHGQRDAREILFLERLARIFDGKGLKGELKLFLTPGHRKGDGGGSGSSSGDAADGERLQIDGVNLPFLRRRMNVDDVAEIIGDDKRSAVVYLCGLPTMTDEFVQKLTSPDGLDLERYRVLYEKWW